MKAFSLFVLVPLLLLSGCTVLIPWNPVLNGLELDKNVSFNRADIGIEINSLGFLNASAGPLVSLQVRNFTRDTLRFSVSGFKVYIGTDTVVQKKRGPVAEEILLPDEQVKLELHYDYLFREFRTIHIGDRLFDVPQPTSLLFAFPEFHLKDSTITIPAIEYVDPYRTAMKTQFVLGDSCLASPAADYRR